MEYDFKREAKRQYLRYFRFWFLAVAVLAVICIVLGARKFAESGRGRTNDEAPAERVYDYEDMLTDAEEEQLRRYIAEKEEELHIDFVVMAIGEEYEGRLIKGVNDMREIADDFWDEHKFGYNKGFKGDGVLLLLVGQKGSYLSTSGRAEEALSNYDIDTVQDAVDVYRKRDPYKAYLAYIDTVARLMSGGRVESSDIMLVLILTLVAALIYAAVHLTQKPAQKTTTVNTYVAGGQPVMNRKGDDFVRKSLTKRHIQTNTGGGGSSGGSSHSGGGGHHVSSSGASHGGGGRWG